MIKLSLEKEGRFISEKLSEKGFFRIFADPSSRTRVRTLMKIKAMDNNKK